MADQPRRHAFPRVLEDAAKHAEQIRRLERVGAACWPATETESLAGWQLGFMSGVTRRANCVLPVEWSGTPELSAAIDAAEAWYRARGLPPVFKLTEAALPTGLPDALAARSYAGEGESDVLARRVDGLPGIADAMDTHEGQVHAVRLLDAPEPEWTAVSHAGRSPDADAVMTAMARRLAAPRIFGLVSIGGQAVCAGFAALSGDWASIAGVHTLDNARRKGAARVLMMALARWSAAAGARMLVLQVERDNKAAAALYRGLGFDRLYGYHYRVARG